MFPVLAQETFTPLTSGSTPTLAGSTGTVPSALSSPSSAPSVDGSVLTSVPFSVFPATPVTLASSPSGAPGAGPLAMMSPTAGVSSAGAVEGDFSGAVVEGDVCAVDMTARRLPRSYEATLSGDFFAPPSPARATAVGFPWGAADTSSCREGPGSGVTAPVGAGPSAPTAAGDESPVPAEHPEANREMVARAARRACLADCLRTWESSERVLGDTRNRKGLASTRE